MGKASVLSLFSVSLLALAACNNAVGTRGVHSAASASKVLADTAEPVLIDNSSSTIGLAFTYFWYDVYESAQDCPEGWAMALRDVAIMDLPEEKQKFLLKAENRSTYYKMGYALSAKRMKETKGVSVCNVPETYNDPEMRIVQGSTAYGRDLDTELPEDARPGRCPVTDFTSPDGKPGIDNQLYRVMGCIDSFRRDPEFAGGAMEDYHIGSYRDGETTTLLEITGVDDARNDPDVEVGIYASSEPTQYDSQKEGLAYASLTVTDNALWHNKTRGRIENGVLITEPFDLRVRLGWSGRPAEYKISNTIIHLKLNEDGGAEGDLAGFFDLKHAYWNNFHDAAGALQVANGYTCPAVWKALQENADGYPDPETGLCQAISTSMKIEAVPAFVIQRPEEELTRYVLDTREYYGASLEEISVDGAELRPLNKGKRRVGDQLADDTAAAEATANGDEL